MSRATKRGRPQRHYRIRVRTERRDPIDYAKLAQAALEQAAMSQPRDHSDVFQSRDHDEFDCSSVSASDDKGAPS